MHPIVEEIFKGIEPQSIFEVGCAGGMLFKDYYDSRPGLMVGGMDITESDINQAKENYPKCAQNFFVWDAFKTPWPLADKSYDLVFTIGTLLMIPRVKPVIAEMLRVGKKVILAEFHDPTLTKTRMEKVDNLDNYYSYRFYRNYETVLADFGIKPEITKVADKWVIRL